jgi:hypothetical protein
LTAAVALACLLGAINLASAPSKSGDDPKFTFEEDCSTFAFSPDNHIAFGVRRAYNYKKYVVQGDDLWISTIDGKRKKVIDGEKLVKVPKFNSYSINELAWSPDSQRLTMLKTTEQITDKQATLGSGQIIVLLDAEGHEIPVQGVKENPLVGAYQGTWLADGVTVAYLTEAIKPKVLFEIHSIQPAGGKAARLFPDHQFAGVAWDAAHNAAIAVERDKGLDEPGKLVWLDLENGTRKELATIEQFQGQLTLSPSRKRIAYFADGDDMEVRNLSTPAKATRVRAGFGRYEWAPDDQHILLKRGPENRSGTIRWLDVATGDFNFALHDLVFHEFHISPDGHWIGVSQPGKRIVQIYALTGLM